MAGIEIESVEATFGRPSPLFVPSPRKEKPMKFTVENVRNPNEPQEVVGLNVLLTEMLPPVFLALEVPGMPPEVHGALHWQLSRRPLKPAISGDWRVRKVSE